MDVAVALALDNEQRLGELKEAWEKALGDLDTYLLHWVCIWELLRTLRGPHQCPRGLGMLSKLANHFVPRMSACGPGLVFSALLS